MAAASGDVGMEDGIDTHKGLGGLRGTLEEVSLAMVKPDSRTGPCMGGDSKQDAAEILAVDDIGMGWGWG